MHSRERVVRLLMRVLNHPRQFTRRQLAEHFGVSTQTVYDDIEAINQLQEFTVKYQKPPYRCFVDFNNRYSELNVMSPLSEEDKFLIARTLQTGMGSNKAADRLIKKVEGLYDFQQLGLRQLRHPAIERINRLEGAKRNKKQVTLVKYRSNNNSIKDRLVECFFIDPELDMIQVYYPEASQVRHFRLSRIERVEVLDTDWQNESRHQHKYTDVFRIASFEQQVQVKLLLNVQAYNILLEYFPTSASHIDPGSEKNTFIFQGKVNHEFKGIINFIMGYAEHIEILAPESLRTAVQKKAESIYKNI
jgi:predicted DNA-binding transcriptional regulator YafY